jgi:hypothetical protein
MAVGASDDQYRAHYQTWIGFTRFIKIMLAFIVLVLIGLALFVA